MEPTIALSDDGPLDRVIAPAEAQHPGQSAFRLAIEGTEAFATRVHTARRAVRSLDVQTYIWHADLTGLFLAQQLIDAGSWRCVSCYWTTWMRVQECRSPHSRHIRTSTCVCLHPLPRAPGCFV